jgi:hypothetical protein
MEGLRELLGSVSIPLAAGDSGIEQTINAIRDLVDDGVKDPQVNSYAIQVLRAGGVGSYDRLGKVQAIYSHVLANFMFVEDPVGPHGPKETLRPARVILTIRAGDCDDLNAILLPSLLGTIGYATRLVTIASDPTDPESFSHIYAEVCVDGQWYAIDAARPQTRFGSAPPYHFRKRVWSLSDSSYHDVVSGSRVHSLSGYVQLGQNDGNPTAQDISSLSTGIATVIASARHAPDDPFSYPASPYQSFATPCSPGGMAYPAGYPGGVSGSVGLNQTTVVLVSLGVIALLFMGGRRR